MPAPACVSTYISITQKKNLLKLSTLSCRTTKNDCAQQRLRSALASAQSDQSSLSAWRSLGSLATHWAHSKDWSYWADAQADPSLHWAQVILLVLSCGGSFVICPLTRKLKSTVLDIFSLVLCMQIFHKNVKLASFNILADCIHQLIYPKMKFSCIALQWYHRVQGQVVDLINNRMCYDQQQNLLLKCANQQQNSDTTNNWMLQK